MFDETLYATDVEYIFNIIKSKKLDIVSENIDNILRQSPVLGDILRQSPVLTLRGQHPRALCVMTSIR
eukprot:295296-Chlamydomonas_euryale.AAC.1